MTSLHPPSFDRNYFSTCIATHQKFFSILLLFLGHVLCETSAKLTVCGLDANDDGSRLTLCASDTHLICIECDVTEGDTLEWTFQPLGNPVTFSPSDDVGEEIVRLPINITLTRKVLNTNDITYRSQFKAFSSVLRNSIKLNGGSLEVSCVASISKSDTILIGVQG